MGHGTKSSTTDCTEFTDGLGVEFGRAAPRGDDHVPVRAGRASATVGARPGTRWGGAPCP